VGLVIYHRLEQVEDNMYKKESIIIIIILLIVSVVLFVIYKNKKISSDYDFKIYFFNSGKADAILISKNNKYILIDTGEDILSDDILKYFENNKITRLEYLIITHFDKDHVGSASNIIDNIEIGEVLQSSYIKESEYYTNYINSLSNKSITPKTITGNYKLSFEDLDIVVNGPEELYENNKSNNSSLIVSIVYDNTKFLFMGDSENARIKDYINNNLDSYDFLKIPYHGNYLKKLNSLLDIVNPRYGVITCSNDDGCEDKTLELLNSYNVRYYMTKNGSISVYSNGKKIIIKQ